MTTPHLADDGRLTMIQQQLNGLLGVLDWGDNDYHADATVEAVHFGFLDTATRQPFEYR